MPRPGNPRKPPEDKPDIPADDDLIPMNPPEPTPSFGVLFGELVRQKRGVKSMSLLELAEMAGVGKSQLSELENGRVKNPQSRTVADLAAALNLSHEELDRLYEKARGASERETASKPLPSKTSMSMQQSIGIIIVIFFGLAVLIGGIIVGYFEYIRNQMPKVPERISTEIAAIPVPDIPQMQTQTAPDIEELRQNTTFTATLQHGKIQIQLSRMDGLPSGTIIEYSNDGELFQRHADDVEYVLGDKFLVNLSNTRWSTTIDPIDFTEKAQQAAFALLERTEMVRCAAGQCVIQLSDFCDGDWSKIGLGKLANEPAVFIDRSICEYHDKRELCLSTPESLFPLAPLEAVFVELHALNNAKFAYKMAAQRRGYGLRDTANVVELHSSQVDAPYATSWFGDSRFQIQLAADSCLHGYFSKGGGDFVTNPGLNVYYDVDGKGNKQADTRVGEVSFSIPTPTQNAISITLAAQSGKVFGPYHYNINADNVFQAYLATARKPTSIQCRKWTREKSKEENLYFSCSVDLRNRDLEEWAHVAEVAFSRTGKSIDEVVPIELPIQELIGIKTGEIKPLKDDKLFEYEPPFGSNDVYFSLRYKDGTQTPMVHVSIPDIVN